MKTRIWIICVASCLLSTSVLSKEEKKPGEKPRELTRDELLIENTQLKAEIARLHADRETLEKTVKELRAFMFRMNQEFQKLEKTEPKKRK